MAAYQDPNDPNYFIDNTTGERRTKAEQYRLDAEFRQNAAWDAFTSRGTRDSGSIDVTRQDFAARVSSKDGKFYRYGYNPATGKMQTEEISGEEYDALRAQAQPSAADQGYYASKQGAGTGLDGSVVPENPNILGQTDPTAQVGNISPNSNPAPITESDLARARQARGQKTLPGYSDTALDNLALNKTPGKSNVYSADVSDFESTFNPFGVHNPVPEVDRGKIDPVLGKLDQYQNILVQLANQDSGLSAAEAQLIKSHELATQRNQLQLESSQRAALGAARGARSREAAALLERQAVGESTFLGQEAARNAALQQTEFEGNLANLRADEEERKKDFRLQAISKAAELGLNVAGMEADLSTSNLQSANNYLNNQFEQLGLDKQLNQQNTSLVMQYLRDMALIQFDYDKMSVEDQQHTGDLLMKKYGIDAETRTALEQIRQANRFRWDQVLTAAIGGLASGTGSVVGTKLISDARQKKNISKIDENDGKLLELLNKIKPVRFEYKNSGLEGATKGFNFGLIAQDLERSELGKALVSNENGVKKVDSARAGLTALAAIPLLMDKIKKLEEEFN